ncbi:MAG TPA: response regulator [Pirellulaceae bacterium]|nr:response regulator [Pirellulaceae bacterium]
MSHRILLADDEIHIRRAAEFKLKREFEVSCAEDGQEAWEMLLKDRPDVLITDLQMPRMNGIELIEHIRANEATADLPVILLTAKGFELAREDIFNTLKVFQLLSKPFSPRELCRLAQMAIEGHESRQTALVTTQV